MIGVHDASNANKVVVIQISPKKKKKKDFTLSQMNSYDQKKKIKLREVLIVNVHHISIFNIQILFQAHQRF